MSYLRSSSLRHHPRPWSGAGLRRAAPGDGAGRGPAKRGDPAGCPPGANPRGTAGVQASQIHILLACFVPRRSQPWVSGSVPQFPHPTPPGQWGLLGHFPKRLQTEALKGMSCPSQPRRDAWSIQRAGPSAGFPPARPPSCRELRDGVRERPGTLPSAPRPGFASRHPPRSPPEIFRASPPPRTNHRSPKFTNTLGQPNRSG